MAPAGNRISFTSERPRMEFWTWDEAGSNELCGRQKETKQLFETYELAQLSDSNNVVFVHGSSGSGKTALVNQLRPLVQKGNGLFLSGKFDCHAAQDPLYVFASALTQLVNELTAKTDKFDDCPKRLRNAVENMVGSEVQALICLAPALEDIFGKGEKRSIATRSADAMGRLQFALCQFFHALSTIMPIVLFFDDVQWSDQISMDLIQAIMHHKRPQKGFALFVALTYRTSGPSSEIHPPGDARCWQQAILSPDSSSHIKQHYHDFFGHTDNVSASTNVINIKVGNLTEVQLNELVAGKVLQPAESVANLSRLVHSKTNGNVLYSLRYLRHLRDKGIVYRNGNKWTWNERIVLAATESTESVDGLLRERFQAMPPFVQKVLQTANCMGGEIDQVALAIVLEDQGAEIDQALQAATNEDMVQLNPERGRYVFVHDRVREAIHASTTAHAWLAGSIGRDLLQRASAPYLGTNICSIAKLINQDLDAIKDQQQCYKAASLNLEAGRKAASMGAFPDASVYLVSGIRLLDKRKDHWSEQYELGINLFTHAADVQVSMANFSLVDELAREVLANATNVDNKISAYVTQIDSAGQQGNLHRAVTIGLDVLRLLDEDFPCLTDEAGIDAEAAKVKRALRRRCNKDLLSLPPMLDRRKIAAMQILSSMHFFAYQAGSAYSKMFATRMVWLVLTHGMVRLGAVAFATYGLVVCSNDDMQGQRLGQAALSLVQKTRATEIQAKLSGWMYGCIHHWSRPLRETLEPLHEAQSVGMQKGDAVFAMMAAHFHCVHSLFSGTPLPKVDQLMSDALGLMKSYKQSNPLGLTKPVFQFVHNLMGKASNPKLLSGQVTKVEEAEEISCNRAAQLSYICYSAKLAFFFGDIDLADELLEQGHKINFQNPSVFRYSIWCFTKGLVAVARIRQGKHATKHRTTVTRVIRQFTKWSRDSPENFQSKRLLLEAEMLSLGSSNKQGTRARKQILDRYHRSVEWAIQQGFIHEAALACELSGDYHQRCGLIEEAMVDWKRSCKLYNDWGAVAKEGHLRSRMAAYLAQET